MTAVLEAFASLLLLGGSLVVAISALGMLRLPDPFMRMHAATKSGVVGSGLVLLGAGLHFGTPGAVLTAVCGVLFLVATVPIASHVLGRAAYVAGAPIAASTVTDALSGVLSRNVFDIDPARTARRRPERALILEERTMKPVPIRDQPLPRESAGSAALKRIHAWLVGGPAQPAASRMAAELALASGAKLTGLSAIDPSAARRREPLGIGGAYWAKWLGEQRRSQMRETSALVLADFQSVVEKARVPAATRHEEGDFESLAVAAASADLVVVPAGVDRAGMPAVHAEEVASWIARSRLAPVLRVRQFQPAVRSVVILVGMTPACGRLAQAFIHSGLWIGARVTVVPVGLRRPLARKLAEEELALLREHHRDAELGEGIDLDSTTEAVVERFRWYDAAVMGTLSDRVGWFGAVREDIYELVADTVPVTLLP